MTIRIVSNSSCPAVITTFNYLERKYTSANISTTGLSYFFHLCM